MNVSTILVIIAVVLFALAAFGVSPTEDNKPHLGWAGLFFWALSTLL